MEIINVILLGLTTWRISYMLVKEIGPLNIFQSLREAFGITHYPDGDMWIIPEKFIPQLLSCIYCTSVWVGAGAIGFYCLFGEISIFIFAPLWLSAIAIFIDTLHERT